MQRIGENAEIPRPGRGTKHTMRAPAAAGEGHHYGDIGLTEPIVSDLDRGTFGR